MKNAIFILLILLAASPAGAKVFYVQPPADPAGAVVIDHNCVDLSAIPQIHIAPAASLRLLLRHASVGQGIGWGLDCFAGLHPTNSECSCYLPGQYPRDNWLLELRAGNWKDKVDDLVTQAAARTDDFDVFTMKFCYIDALGDSHPDWDYYRAAMEQLELDYPDKVFVWWTIPLTRDGMPGTDFFNALVRSYCRANGKILFDIADIECHDPNGLKQTNAYGCEVICQDYTKEIHAGHLNVPGRIRVASALWQLMASIAGWHKGSIQAAIDAASNGDTIIVTPGRYTGPGNRDIDFLGKAITVRSTNPNDPNIVASTIIDCNGSESDPHRGFYFRTSEEGNSILAGLTITNAYAEYGAGVCCHASNPTLTRCTLTRNTACYGGGGILNDFASPTLNDCTFRSNVASGGGGMFNSSSSPKLTNCTFRDNLASPYSGGAIGNGGDEDLSDGVLTNCIFSGNSGHLDGGAVCNWWGNLTLTNCIFAGNSARAKGGAIKNHENGRSALTNCTFAMNSAPNGNALACEQGYWTFEVYSYLDNCILWDHGNEIWNAGSRITVTHSDVKGGCPGQANIDADPCFGDRGYWDSNGTPGNPNDDYWIDGDYHLKSQAGRWDVNEGRWVIDEVTSPCIDVGDPMTPIGREPFPNGGIVNMGAYGGTAEASKSYFGKPPCEIIVAGDINGDCAVNFLDFRLMALHWLTNGNL